jgi:CRP-like cAMP-binding protein
MQGSAQYDPYPVLTDDELAALESVGQVIHRPAGSLLLGGGEETDFVLVLRKGTVRIVQGCSARVIALRGTGQVVGEQAAITGRARSASVFAEDAMEALYLSANVWRQFLLDHPRAAIAQLAVAYDRLAESDRKLVESSLAVEQKLAKALVELESKGLGVRAEDGIVVRFSQLDLASLMGVSRDAVVPVIRALKANDIVRTGRKKITIRNLDALYEIARGDRMASG